MAQPHSITAQVLGASATTTAISATNASRSWLLITSICTVIIGMVAIIFSQVAKRAR